MEDPFYRVLLYLQTHIRGFMSRTFFWLSQLIIAFLLTVNAAAFTAQTAASAPGAPPVQWPRSHNYDVQHYKIKVRFDWKEKSVTGETTITLKPYPDDLSEVELDAGQM